MQFNSNLNLGMKVGGFVSMNEVSQHISDPDEVLVGRENGVSEKVQALDSDNG